jgi:Protein of unknown function (DUF4242)
VSEFVAECLWPGVLESDLAALDERATSCAARLDSDVRYLGSLLMPEDEVVLCLFQGDRDAVRKVVEEAEIPFERILETSRSGWRDGEPRA